MRAGIVVNITRADRRRLEATVSDRCAPQKHVWRAQIILATAKPVVWNRRLKRGVFRSVPELQAAIDRFVAETNADPKPFVWSARPNRILDAVKRGKEKLESIH
jgi:hypothetical protein